MYVGLGLRYPHCTPSAGKRGATEDVFAIPGVWVELDHRGGVHAAPNLPTWKETGGVYPNASPLRFHLWSTAAVACTAMCSLSNSSCLIPLRSAANAQLLVRRFQRTIQLWASEHHWKVDNTADLARGASSCWNI